MKITEIKSQSNLYLKWGKECFGWGVFTDSTIKSGDVVETCYCLIDNYDKAPYKDYAYHPDINTQDVYHCLGFGAIYNHSDSPNIVWKMIDNERSLIQFYVLRDIEAGEQLYHSYGKDYWINRGKKSLI